MQIDPIRIKSYFESHDLKIIFSTIWARSLDVSLPGLGDLFMRLDRNGDGLLDKHDIVEGLKLLGDSYLPAETSFEQHMPADKVMCYSGSLD